jgi:hypothetical protein
MAHKLHDYRRVAVATRYDYSAIALVAGESTGPSLHLKSCVKCSTVRVSNDRQTNVRYLHHGELSFLEPPCIALVNP